MTSPPQIPASDPTAAMPPLTALSHALTHFATSPTASFQIIHTIPSSLARLPTKRLYILDSSFNPPTWAHMRMCLSALKCDEHSGDGHNTGPKRLLLLLATKNADKPAAPAGFEHRLAMMGAFAEDLKGCLAEQRKDIETSSQEEGRPGAIRKVASGGDGAGLAGKKKPEGNGLKGSEVSKETAKESKGSEQEKDPDVIIDIGVTKEAMFVEKARVIEESGLYVVPLQEKGQVGQVHLTGYDTLIRLVNPKYYPPELRLAPLKRLFDKHSVRVMMRSPPSIEEQVGFVQGLKDSSREAQGWKREWAEKVELVEGKDHRQEGISSTRARENFKDSKSRERQGGQWCSDSVVEYVLREGLYLDGGTQEDGRERGLDSGEQ